MHHILPCLWTRHMGNSFRCYIVFLSTKTRSAQGLEDVCKFSAGIRFAHEEVRLIPIKSVRIQRCQRAKRTKLAAQKPCAAKVQATARLDVAKHSQNTLHVACETGFTTLALSVPRPRLHFHLHSFDMQT